MIRGQLFPPHTPSYTREDHFQRNETLTHTVPHTGNGAAGPSGLTSHRCPRLALSRPAAGTARIPSTSEASELPAGRPARPPRHEQADGRGPGTSEGHHIPARGRPPVSLAARPALDGLAH